MLTNRWNRWSYLSKGEEKKRTLKEQRGINGLGRDAETQERSENRVVHGERREEIAKEKSGLTCFCGPSIHEKRQSGYGCFCARQSCRKG